MSTDEMRNLVRPQIETLERWLRRLVDDALRAHYGGALSALPIKQKVKADVADRRSNDPQRYPREVDALLLNDLIAIICKQELYPHFRDALHDAFPDGAAEAQTFLGRIVDPRNPLSHANDITTHQALQAMCYATDVIASLKAHYARNNMAQTYNGPSFYRVWDGIGNSGQIDRTNHAEVRFNATPLRPGDILEMEVQIDESLAEHPFEIEWIVCNVKVAERGTGHKFVLPIRPVHVNQDGLTIRCQIVSTREWQRHGTYEAMFHAFYPVLPPV
ncbi:hypothetical protein [Burkholderia territorii]|uniref:hypothetical protein n=1 Tax=Burkholderia territorii TaxID=1503055 RepID=UPI0012D85655|nr:hypothetical protein [Burkholderia territorii]